MVHQWTSILKPERMLPIGESTTALYIRIRIRSGLQPPLSLALSASPIQSHPFLPCRTHLTRISLHHGYQWSLPTIHCFLSSSALPSISSLSPFSADLRSETRRSNRQYTTCAPLPSSTFSRSMGGISSTTSPTCTACRFSNTPYRHARRSSSSATLLDKRRRGCVCSSASTDTCRSAVSLESGSINRMGFSPSSLVL